MEKQTAFETLGVAPGSDERTVRRAYRGLLFELEDKGQSDPGYPAKKERLEQAFAVCLEEAKSVAPTIASALPETPDEKGATRKKTLRFLVGALGAVSIFALFLFFQQSTVDVDGKDASDTAGMIAALETVGQNTKLVVFKFDGTKTDVPGYVGGTSDRDPAWRPDGSRLLFTSNRDGNFNIYRWDPVRGKVAARSNLKRAKSNLWFGLTDDPKQADSGLFTSGGFVFKYDQKTGATEQLLPVPKGKTAVESDEGGGSTGQLDAVYDKIGKGFKTARWGPGRLSVYTVMDREGDDVFVQNPLTQEINKGRPLPFVAARRIEFDTDAAGDALIAIRHFQFVDPENVPEEYLKDGRAVPPYDSGLMLVPANGSQPVLICQTQGPKFFLGKPDKPLITSKKGSMTIGSPRLSPDGSVVAFVIGDTSGERGIQGQGVMVVPLKAGTPFEGPQMVAEGHVEDLAWSPDGRYIAFTDQVSPTERTLNLVDFQAKQATVLGKGGLFSSPAFSPQTGGSPKAS
ncbi:MAG: PD40 domain-containing protein [Armatimonadetes bacterium]|nr:PD40 domain-containing protein [Armatimonadota bacterium]